MPTIVATTLPGAVPGISIVASGLTTTVTYELEGQGEDGRAYRPRGYRLFGEAGGGIVDSVFPLSGAITYVLRDRATGLSVATTTITPGFTYSSPVELSSYDGSLRIAADLASDRAGGLGTAWTMRRNVVDISGSSVRYATWDTPIEGGPTLSFRVRRGGQDAIRNLVASGDPIYVRTAVGWAGDLSASRLWAVEEAAYEFEGLDDETYLWSLKLAPTNDPTPRIRVAVSDWTAFNAAMVRKGWNYTDLQNFLATFPSWAAAATFDWSTL